MSTRNLKYLGMAGILLAASTGTAWAQAKVILRGSTEVSIPAAPPTAPVGAPVASLKVEPTTFALQLDETLAEDVFTQITTQTGIKFYTEPGNLFEQDQYQIPKPILVEKKAFWAAMKEVCETYNIYPQLYNYGRSGVGNQRICMTQHNNPWGNHPSCVTDLFLITANSINRSSYINLGNPEANRNNAAGDSISVNFTIFADPKLRLGPVSSQFKLEEAKDENGLSLIRAGNENQYYGGYRESQRTSIWQASASLIRPENAGERIASFKGTLQATIYTKIEKWEVADILKAKDVSKTFGATTYTIKKVTASTNKYPSYTVELSVSTTAPVNNFGSNNNFDTNSAQLLDAEGNIYSVNGWSGGGSGSRMDRSMTFSAPRNYVDGVEVGTAGEPVKFVMELPTATKDVSIPVTFTDLPLP